MVELFFLRGIGQFAIEDQVGNFQKIRVFGQLLDRIAAVHQDALVAVDISDVRTAAGCRHETGVESELAGFRVQAAHIDHVGADGTAEYRKINRRRAIAERQGCQLFAHNILHVINGLKNTSPIQP